MNKSVEENKAFYEGMSHSAKKMLDRILELRVDCSIMELDLTCGYATELRHELNPGKCSAVLCIVDSTEAKDLTEMEDMHQENMIVSDSDIPEIKIEKAE